METYSLEEQLLLLEERLLEKSIKDFEDILADDFIEFGSSGRTYNKQQAIDGLINQSIVQMTLMDFKAQLLSPNVALATYRAVNHSDMKYSLRSSIWKLNEGQWQMVFHQGTPTNASAKG